jgi:outer membrane protein assembly factor BamB
MRHFVLFAFLPVLVAVPSARAENSWPQFRGSHSGTADGTGLPTSWSTTKNVVWKTEIPGLGWSSPVVWGDRVFVTAAVSEHKAAAPPKGYGGNFEVSAGGIHRWNVYCLDWKTGRILWQKTAFKGKPPSTKHLKNTYASETPVTDGKRVYAYFGNVGLFCYDMSGQLLWSRSWGAHKTRVGWGTGASPVLYKGRIYIVNDNEEKSFLTAVDAEKGTVVWEVPRDEKSNWSSPIIWESNGRAEIVTNGSGKVRSYSLDGKVLWELAGMSSLTIPTPSSQNGLLYVSSGFTFDFAKRPIFAIRPGASGDITPKKDQAPSKFIAWNQPYAAPYHPSPLIYGDSVYVLHDRGKMDCYDAKTGKMVYKRQEVAPSGPIFTASPVGGDGKVFCLNEDGTTFVVEAGPKLKVLAKNRLDEMCMATPALVGNNLLIRTETKLYRIGEEKTTNGK